jgi:energy-coupling factor transporter ATP-binding protein EcfA2
LLRLLTGAVPQLSGGTLTGGVSVLGRDPTTTPPRQMAAAGVAFVHQNPAESLVAGRVAEEVAFGPRNLGLGGPELRVRVDGALAAVGLADRATEPVRALSTGEQQRLALAAALALRPRLLVADEPTAHLDPASAAALLGLIAAARGTGITVLLAEHRLGIAAPLADRAIVLIDGAVAADGAPRRVFAERGLADRGVPVSRATTAAIALGLTEPLPLTADELACAVGG